jgi:cellulose synthase/poly-beta-1,6-N-acetylglucosamine synthase-like glycosyltransferase
MSRMKLLDTVLLPSFLIQKGRNKTRKLRAVFNNLNDRTISPIFFFLFVGYIVAYGLFISEGFHPTPFDLSYAVIIIPIFLIDCVRSMVELCVRSDFYPATQKLKRVTVVIACKDGNPVLSPTLEDLCRRFKPEQIIVASNGSTDNTCAIAKRYGVRFLNMKEALGKVRSINVALSLIETPYTLIMDDDTLIKDAIVPTSCLDDGFNAVAFRVLPVRKGWLTCLQLHEYRKSCDISKRAHNRWATVQNISGAIGLFKTHELLRQVVLHSGEFSGEDLQRTLLVHLSAQWRGVVLADSLVYTEAPSTLRSLYQQRVFGWFPGLYANFMYYFRLLFRKSTPISLRLDAFYNCILVVVLDVFRAIAFPIIIFYPWYFVVMYIVYVFLELITYHSLGHKEPAWIILVFPIYGLFGLLTRLAAIGVFIYRRTSVRIAHYSFLDDYRRASRFAKIGGILVATLVYVLLFSARFLYEYF